MSGASRPAWAAARSARLDKEHETRSELLDAAARVFARLGYAATTVAAITDEARVARATFYVYFITKAEVFEQVAARVRDEFLAAHEIPGVDPDDPLALGRASSEAFLAAWAANVGLMTVIEHQAIADERIRAIWDEIQRRPTRRVARYVARLAEAGIAAPAAPPEVVAEAVFGMFSRLGGRVPDDDASFQRLVEQLTTMYLRLIGVEAAFPAPPMSPGPTNVPPD